MRCPMQAPKSRYAYKSPMIQCKMPVESKVTCFPTDVAYESEPDIWITPIAFARICTFHSSIIEVAKFQASQKLTAAVSSLTN